MTIMIENLTFNEKIQVMEQLWENLSQTPTNDTHQITPKWHETVLQNRLEASDSEFIDWKIAKEQLRVSIK